MARALVGLVCAVHLHNAPKQKGVADRVPRREEQRAQRASGTERKGKKSIRRPRELTERRGRSRLAIQLPPPLLAREVLDVRPRHMQVWPALEQNLYDRTGAHTGAQHDQRQLTLFAAEAPTGRIPASSTGANVSEEVA